METTHFPSDFLPERLIVGSSGGDDLREANSPKKGTKLGSRPHVAHTMKRLRPPLVPLNAKPGHSNGIAHQQPDLLLQCQPSDQVLNPTVNWHPHLAKLQRSGYRVSRVAGEGWMSMHNCNMCFH
ncbi:hypothetical protein FF1_038252 [Malus domestica]